MKGKSQTLNMMISCSVSGGQKVCTDTQHTIVSTRMYIVGGVELETTEVQEIYCRTRLVFQILAETLALFVRAPNPAPSP